MNTILKLFVLALAVICGGCGNYGELSQRLSLNQAAFIGVSNGPEQAEVYNRVMATGGKCWNGEKHETCPRNDDAAADLLEQVRDDASVTGRAVRALLVSNIAQREQPSVRLLEGMTRELGVSETRFIQQPEDVREYLAWATLAMKLGDHASIDRVGAAAAVDPRMISTIRRDCATLDAVVKDLKDRQHGDLAARIDWPEEMRANAQLQRDAQGFAQGIVMLPMLPVWIVFGAEF